MEAEKITLSNNLSDGDDFVIMPPNYLLIETTCVSYRKTVTVKPILYGSGYIATCPECDKLVMNSSKEEVKKMRRV